MEQMDIRSRLPNANVRSCGVWVHCGLLLLRRSHKGCAWKRGPFDAFDAAGFGRSSAHAVPARLVVPDMSSNIAFDLLSKQELQRRFLFHGLIGPIDIYTPDKRQLLACRCVTKCVVMVVERKWSNGCGPAALSRAVGSLVGRGTKALATRRVNAALQARGLPPVRGICCRFPRTSMLYVFRRVGLGSTCGHAWNQDEKA